MITLFYIVSIILLLSLFFILIFSKNETRYKKPTTSLQSLVLLLTFIFAVYSFNVTNDRIDSKSKEIDSLNYKLRSLEFNPKLKPIRLPKIDHFYIDPTNILFSKDTSKAINKIELPINLHFDFSVKNVGNTDANLILVGISDSLTDNKYLREYLLSESDFNQVNKINEPFPEYFNSEILSEDTLFMQLHSVAQKVEKSEFTLHLQLVYKNRLGQVYDTYIITLFERVPQLWSKVQMGVQPDKLRPHLIPVDSFDGEEDIVVQIGEPIQLENGPYIPISNQANNYFRIKNHTVSYKLFSSVESKIISQFYEKIKSNL